MLRVSIVTALHNKGLYIAETVRSVLAQTMPDWELIVVENRSSDNGPEEVSKFADSRVLLVESSKCGPGAARNCGLSLAVGEWILFLDADDLIEPEHLDNLLQAAATNSSAAIIAGGWKEFADSAPTELTAHRPATFGFGQIEILERAVALAPWILHAAMVKRSILFESNYWPEHLDAYPDEDTAFWFQILLDAPVAWANHAGALYRRFAVNSRSDSKNLQKRARGYSQIVEHNVATAHKRGIKLSPRCYEHISMMFEVNYRSAVETRDKAAAEFALKNAVYWLGKCSGNSWNIRLRKLLGIPVVTRLKWNLQRAQRVHFSK